MDDATATVVRSYVEDETGPADLVGRRLWYWHCPVCRTGVGEWLTESGALIDAWNHVRTHEEK